MRDPATGRGHATQVKTGDEHIDLRALAKAPGLDDWVVFSPRGGYHGRCPTHVERLDADAIIAFMTERPSALPPILATWTQAALPR